MSNCYLKFNNSIAKLVIEEKDKNKVLKEYELWKKIYHNSCSFKDFIKWYQKYNKDTNLKLMSLKAI